MRDAREYGRRTVDTRDVTKLSAGDTITNERASELANDGHESCDLTSCLVLGHGGVLTRNRSDGIHETRS